MMSKAGWLHFGIRAGLIGLVAVGCSSTYSKDRSVDSGIGGTSAGGTGATATPTNTTSAGGVAGTVTSTSVSSAASTTDGGIGGSVSVGGSGGVAGNGGVGGVAGNGGTEPGACTPEQRECQGVCVALEACCGNEECPAGESCQDNECTCNQGTKRCDEACIAETACCSDDDCPAGGTCSNGECSCGAGTHQCGDSCVDSSSVDTCGVVCDEPCTAPGGGSVICDAGECIPSCPGGQVACVGECIDENDVCDGECPGASHDCSGVCLQNTSLLACGDSCTPCPVPANANATCDGTACDFTCHSTFSRCGDECIPAGACCDDGDCGSGVSCVDNQCACTLDSKLCDDACIDEDACCDSSECQENAVCNGSNSCECESAFRSCEGQCIPDSDCCDSNDCDDNEACSSGACDCAPNFKRCSSSGACIPDVSCCDDDDCSDNASCEGGSCECDSGYFGTDCDYYFTGLGFLSGDNYSQALGVSADGSSVVGASRTGASGAPTAFRWKNGTLTNLGVLSGGESIAYATSSDGAIVVGDAKLTASVTVGFRWSSNSIEALELASYGTYSTARDISDDGSVIVGWGDRDIEHRALVWTNEVVDTRGSIDPLYFNAVTPSGDIYAGKMVSAPMTYESSVTELGLLNGYTGGEVLALAASGSTRGVGFLVGSPERAVRWTLGGDAVDLGTLGAASRALAVSADGAVIVGVSNNQAFIWDSENGLRALGTVLSDAGIDLDGWVLQSATGVSADGETVVGYGSHGGTTEAFAVVMP